MKSALRALFITNKGYKHKFNQTAEAKPRQRLKGSNFGT